MMRKTLYGYSFMLLAAAWSAAAAEGESNLFAGDIGNAVWTVVIFLLVLLVLGKFAWGPLLSGLQQREEFIRNSLLEARRDREEAEATLAEYTAKLTAARAEATAITEEGRRDGEEVKRRIEGEARQEADAIVTRARREIDLAKQTAIKEIYTTSASLATEIAGRVLKKELTAEDQERLMKGSLDELRSMRGDN